MSEKAQPNTQAPPKAPSAEQHQANGAAPRVGAQQTLDDRMKTMSFMQLLRVGLAAGGSVGPAGLPLDLSVIEKMLFTPGDDAKNSTYGSNGKSSLKAPSLLATSRGEDDSCEKKAGTTTQGMSSNHFPPDDVDSRDPR
jgi:hypothetical protein